LIILLLQVVALVLVVEVVEEVQVVFKQELGIQ
jgi:hypothetical protein